MISNKKNYLFTLGSNLAVNTISTILGIVAVPISLNYWKVERYGVWALVTSLLTYLSMTNLGLNSAATVFISKNPRIDEKFLILKKTFKIMLLTVSLGAVSFILINLLDRNWIAVLGKIPAYLKNETFYACLILGIFYLFNLPFTLISSSFVGFQKAYIDNIFNFLLAITNFLGLLGVILIKGNLVMFALFYGLSLTSISLSKAVYFYFNLYRKYLPENNIKAVYEEKDDLNYKHILTTGIRFFFIGIAAMVVWNSDNFVISNFLGIGSVTPYSITFKLYNILFMLIFMISSSIMPIMAKEFGKSNWEWINRTYSGFLALISIVGGLAWVGGLVFFKDVITLWAGSKSFAGLLCVFALGGYSYLASMANLNVGIAQTFNYTKGLPLLGWLEALVKIGFSIFLLHFWGMAGVAVGTLLGMLLAPTIFLPRWIIKRSEHRIKYDLNFVLRHFTLVLFPLLILGVLTQLFVTNIFARLFIGVMIVLTYIFISFILVPEAIKVFIKNNYYKVLEKMGIKTDNIDTNSDVLTPNERTAF